MLAHTLFSLFAHCLLPFEFKSSHTKESASEEECLWRYSSPLHEIAVEALKKNSEW
jgi:hypothetical protein